MPLPIERVLYHESAYLNEEMTQPTEEAKTINVYGMEIWL